MIPHKTLKWTLLGEHHRCDHGRQRSSSFCRGMGDLGKLAAWNLCFRPSRVSLGGDSPESRFPEALPMRQLRLFPDNPPGPRWISPPWTTASDRWLEIELDLPADPRARRFAQIVAELDLTALVGSYAGLGSPAYPPELLVRLALFEIHRGCLSPAQWYEDCRYDDAAKWLVFGLRPVANLPVSVSRSRRAVPGSVEPVCPANRTGGGTDTHEAGCVDGSFRGLLRLAAYPDQSQGGSPSGASSSTPPWRPISRPRRKALRSRPRPPTSDRGWSTKFSLAAPTPWSRSRRPSPHRWWWISPPGGERPGASPDRSADASSDRRGHVPVGDRPSDRSRHCQRPRRKSPPGWPRHPEVGFASGSAIAELRS